MAERWDKARVLHLLADLPPLAWLRVVSLAELHLEGLTHGAEGLYDPAEVDEKVKPLLTGVRTPEAAAELVDIVYEIMVEQTATGVPARAGGYMHAVREGGRVKPDVTGSGEI